MGLDSGECGCSTDTSGWFGHQSSFVLGRCGVGVGAGIPGFSLSLTLSVAPFVVSFVVSDTSAHLLFRSGSDWLVIASSPCSVRRGRCAGGTVAAPAPVDDLCFIDLVARAVDRGQAGGVAHGAVDVHHPPTDPAHELMVVVADSVLVAGRRPRGFDPAEPPPVREG